MVEMKLLPKGALASFFSSAFSLYMCVELRTECEPNETTRLDSFPSAFVMRCVGISCAMEILM